MKERTGKTQIHGTPGTSEKVAAEQRSGTSDLLQRNHRVLWQAGWHLAIRTKNRKRLRAIHMGCVSTGESQTFRSKYRTESGNFGENVPD